jgi:hypothetical protein
MLLKSKILPFWLFTLSTIIILIVSQLIQDGSFMDGMLYICVSKNLAMGNGTFWNLNFSQTYLSSFNEQPPLYFGLLALFYKVLGTSMYVERLFCLVCFATNAFFIHKLWTKIYSSNPLIARNSWLPILFWTTIPVCFWAYINHVEETVMSVFTIASVYFIYSALFLNQKVIRNILFGGLFIFLASLTKGIQGLFPIVAIGAYWLVIRDLSFKKMVMYSLLLISIPVGLYLFLVLTNHNVYESYQRYFETRLVRTFNNVGSTTGNRFELLFILIQELLPIVAISSLILFFTKKYKAVDNEDSNHYKTIVWFLLIGLAGALPLMVTLEQRGFYLVTTMPFFAMAIAMWLAPRLTSLINKINIKTTNFKIAKVTTLLLFLFSIAFSVMQIGKFKRDEGVLKDIYTIGNIVPQKSIINIPKDMGNDWSIICYFERYLNISLESENKHTYFIIRKDLPKALIPSNYKLYPLQTINLELYRLSE